MQIREAQPDDRDAVVALWESAGLTRPWNDAFVDFDRALDQPQSTVLIAESEDIAVGAVMVGDDGHRGWLYYLAVAGDRQRTGIGRQLVRAAEQWLLARGQDRVRLMIRNENTAVVGFYLALGYNDQDSGTFGITSS